MKFAYIRNDEVINIAEFESEQAMLAVKDIFLEQNNLHDIVALDKNTYPFPPVKQDPRVGILEKLGLTEEEAKALIG